MRRSLLAGLGAGVLVLTGLQAAGAATRVDGDHFAASGLRVATQGCSDPMAQPTTEPRFRIRDGKVPLGQRAVGWRMDGTTFGTGPEVRVASPSTTTKLRLKLNAPGDAASGQAVVTYFAPDDPGVWKGTGALEADTESGWHTVDASDVIYQWRHYTDGAFDESAPSARLASFVASRGGDGDGAFLGIIHGCDGNPFFIDAFTVGNAEAARTFDFEGFRTRPVLRIGGEAVSRRTITFGQRLEVDGRLFQKVEDRRLAGKLVLEGRRLTAKNFGRVGADRTTRTRDAEVRVAPAKSSAFRWRYAGTTANEPGTSEVVRVIVRVRVAAHLVDDRIVRGQSFTVAGRVAPGGVRAIQLQRYRNGSWSTVKRGRTGGDGGFRIGLRPSGTGTSYWRVKAAAGDGNAANTSRHLKLVVYAPSNPNPPDDPDDPPPPPPPPEG